jgi:hypothetical protein
MSRASALTAITGMITTMIMATGIIITTAITITAMITTTIITTPTITAINTITIITLEMAPTATITRTTIRPIPMRITLMGRVSGIRSG